MTLYSHSANIFFAKKVIILKLKKVIAVSLLFTQLLITSACKSKEKEYTSFEELIEDCYYSPDLSLFPYVFNKERISLINKVLKYARYSNEFNDIALEIVKKKTSYYEEMTNEDNLKELSEEEIDEALNWAYTNEKEISKCRFSKKERETYCEYLKDNNVLSAINYINHYLNNEGYEIILNALKDYCKVVRADRFDYTYGDFNLKYSNYDPLKVTPYKDERELVEAYKELYYLDKSIDSSYDYDRNEIYNDSIAMILRR